MTTKTRRLRRAEMEHTWHVLDAGEQSLGRLASEIAKLLLGKHKPTYEPHLAMGDYVVVVNARRVEVTGSKAGGKIYYRHSGYPGGLRQRTFQEQMDRDPRWVVERAVRGMLPHNSRGRDLFRRLHVYAGPDHPHTAQVMAGTGARARKRAAREAAAATAGPPTAEVTAKAVETAEAQPPAEVVEAVEATAPSADETVAPARPRSLNRWKRAELDEEATRVGIEIDPDWKKADVIAAIEQQRSDADAADGE